MRRCGWSTRRAGDRLFYRVRPRGLVVQRQAGRLATAIQGNTQVTNKVVSCEYVIGIRESSPGLGVLRGLCTPTADGVIICLCCGRDVCQCVLSTHLPYPLQHIVRLPRKFVPAPPPYGLEPKRRPVSREILRKFVPPHPLPAQTEETNCKFKGGSPLERFFSPRDWAIPSSNPGRLRFRQLKT